MAPSDLDLADLADSDGLLIDIVVGDMTDQEWATVAAYFAANPTVWTPEVSLDQIAAAQAEGENGIEILARGDLPGQLNAWFLIDELEIDFDPRLVTEQHHIACLLDFMRDLGQLLRRDVTMSWEGSRTPVVCRYRHATDGFEPRQR